MDHLRRKALLQAFCRRSLSKLGRQKLKKDIILWLLRLKRYIGGVKRYQGRLQADHSRGTVKYLDS